MLPLRVLIGLLIPQAHAVLLNQAGSQNQGVQTMWQQICMVMPFCNVGPNAPRFFVGKVIHFALYAITAIAVCMIIYAGIKLVISQGSDEAFTDAKKIILYALAGIALAMLGQAIMVYISTVVLRQILGS